MSAHTSDIATLYAAEHERLERQIYRRVGCRSTACDLVHDIFLRLWERATERKGDTGAYLTRCARNAAIDHARAKTTRREFAQGILPEQYAAPSPTPFDVLAARQGVQHLDAVLMSLPKKTRHIFLLNRVHGRSFCEIAVAFGISPRAVAKHMARAVAECETID